MVNLMHQQELPLMDRIIFLLLIGEIQGKKNIFIKNIFI